MLAYRWLRTQTQAPLTLWGLRVGCLLAASVASKLPERVNFIFWQPVISGRQYWQQFMRLKMAGELGAGQPKDVSEQLRQQLVAGEIVEIAGYMLSPLLVEGLEAAELEPSVGLGGQVIWLETSLRDEATLAPLSQKWIERWRAAGYAVQAQVVRGPSFWQTSEIEYAPELIAVTQNVSEALL